MARKLVGLYPGTFDPTTLGHIDIIKRGARIVDKLIVGVGINTGKSPMFSLAERCEMLEEVVAPIAEKTGTEITIRGIEGLLVDYAEQSGASIILRGLRAVTDFDYEFQMVGMNARLNPDIETVFLTASEKHQFIASRLVKEVGLMGGDVRHFLTPEIAARVEVRCAEMRAR